MTKTERYYVDYDGGTSVPVKAKSFEHAAKIIAKREKDLWEEGHIFVRLERVFSVGEIKNA